MNKITINNQEYEKTLGLAGDLNNSVLYQGNWYAPVRKPLFITEY